MQTDDLYRGPMPCDGHVVTRPVLIHSATGAAHAAVDRMIERRRAAEEESEVEPAPVVVVGGDVGIAQEGF